MSFQVKILLLSFVASTVISMIVIPILRRLKVGQSEREEGPQSHLSKKGTPTMGGIILIISTLIISAFLYIDYSASEPEIATRLLPMIFVTIGFGLVGFVDDFKKVILHNTDGLSPKAKMAGLLIISIAYVAMLVFCISKWNRHIHSIYKKINRTTSMDLHTICSSSNFSYNKCCKFNRWYRRTSNKCNNNNINMFNSNINNMEYKRDNNIWMYSSWSRTRILII